MDGRVYFRARSASGKSSLKEVTYTTDNDQATYQQRLFGRRHFSIRKNAKLQKHKWKNNVNIESDKKIMSLFETCMLLVIYNLDMVDSLYGLPSLIGEQIFNKAVKHRQFSIEHYDALQHRICLFAEPYSDEIFQSLNLDRKQMFLAQLLDEITLLFPYLHSIRLSDCGIGDEHEVLLQLGKLYQLNYLSLEKNEIGDAGVKNLLQTRRRIKQGLNNLENLNISRNKNITFTSLPHLLSLPKLQAISIDATKEDVMTLKYSFSLRCTNRNRHIKALGQEHLGNDSLDGWGCPLLKSWLRDFELEESDRLKNVKANAGKLKSSFYKSTRSVIPPVSSTTVLQSIRSPVTLCLCDFRKARKGINQKRKRDPMDISNISRSKKNKILKSYDTNADDDEQLMEIYNK